MKAIHIDSAPRTVQRAIARTSARTWLLAGCGAALCLGGMIAANILDARQQENQTRLEQLRTDATERAVSTDTRNAPAISGTQANAINGIVQQLNIPWDRLLGAFDLATPSTIAVLELVPDAKKHSVKGVAEAATAEAMLAYIERLKQQPALGNVVLTKHEVNAEDANKPLRFEFEANWPEVAQ
jgi:Tfp pilus assembly protein PilN